MPVYQIAEIVIAVARNALLIDTNVLVDAFLKADVQRADDYFEKFPGPLLIPTVVVVEAWGLLVGSRKLRSAGLALLTWLNLPDRATILPARQADFQLTHQITSGHWVDCVDAMLVELATDISDHCNLKPPLAIATTDTRDFTRLHGLPDVRFRIFDLKNGIAF